MHKQFSHKVYFFIHKNKNSSIHYIELYKIELPIDSLLSYFTSIISLYYICI